MNSFIIEVGSVDFLNSDTQTVTFEIEHKSVPKVTASFFDASSSVNVSIANITRTQVIINTSSKIHGKVHYHAISSIN